MIGHPTAADATGRVLRLSRPRRTYVFGAFALDAERQILWRGSEQIRLGSRAMAILTALAERGGALVGKDELVRAVWPTTFVEEVNLRVHISTLRRALGEAPGEPSLIANVAGRGYRLTVEVAELVGGPGVIPADPSPRREMPDRAAGLVGLGPSVAAVLGLLRERRLVAICGPEGAGKTALAVEASLRLDGADTAVRAFEATGATSADLATMLHGLERIGRDRLMVLIDGLGPDAAAALGPRLDELVRRNPGLRVLATSEGPIAGRGWTSFALDGLPLAGPEGAEALFAARAAVCSPGAAEGASPEDVTLICRHTAGRPLAVRIAAAAAAGLGSRRLARRLDEAAAGGANHGQVQRAVAEWLIDTLPPDDAATLRRVSVFCTAFTLDAAVAIAADERLPPEAVVASLGNLLDASLVETSVLQAPRRFRLRAEVRQLAESEALLAGETAGLRQRLTGWLVSRFDAAARDDRGRLAWRESVAPLLAEASATLDVLSTVAAPSDYAELARAALPAAVEDRQGKALLAHAMQALSQISGAPAPDHRASAALSLEIALSELERHGPSPMADRLFDRVCRECGPAPELRAEAFFGMARTALGRGDFETARQYGEMSAQMRRREAPGALPLTDGLRAEIEHGCGNHVVARDLAIEVLRDAALARTAGPARGALMVQMRVIAARTLWLTGKADSARRALTDALEHAEVEGPLPLCRTLAGAACIIAFWCGRDEEAAAHAARLAEIAARAELPYWQGWAEVYDAAVNILAAREGRANRRARLPEMTALQQQTMATVTGLPMARAGEGSNALPRVSWCLPELMRLEGVRRLAAAEAGAAEEAEPYFLRALDLARRQGALAWELRAAMSLATLAPALARPDATSPLAEVYARFAEGRDTADLTVARAMLRMPDGDESGRRV